MIKDEIMEELPAYHGSTYGGVPIFLARNMAALEYMQKYKLLDRVNILSDIIEKRFKECRVLDKIYQARGWRLLKAVDFANLRVNHLYSTKTRLKQSYSKEELLMGWGQGRYLSMLRIIPPTPFQNIS